MRVTSLEISRQLYVATGYKWNPNDRRWVKTPMRAYGQPVDDYRMWKVVPVGYRGKTAATWYPAYDLGYLLRKLPEGFTIVTRFNDEWLASWAPHVDEPDYAHLARTPEDAISMLIMELIEKGILKVRRDAATT